LADLEFAAKEDPEYRSASYNLARAYRAVGRNTEAQQVFARIHDQSSSTVSETGNRRLTDALAPKGSTSQ
jgi:thioredoxin-like negative regulator of GroEL